MDRTEVPRGASFDEAMWEKVNLGDNVAEIVVSDIVVSTEYALKIARAFPSFTRLMRVEFSGAHLHRNSVSALMAAMTLNETVIDLTINHDPLTLDDFGDIADMLDINTTLIALKLTHVHLTLEGLSHIASSVNTNTTLKLLDIGHNPIEGADIQPLAKALKHNTVLTHLGLNSISLRTKGYKRLLRCLARNRTLTDIDLSRTKPGSEMAARFFEFMSANDTLIGLKFAENRLDKTATPLLTDMIRQNTTLQRLWVSYTRISDASETSALVDALLTNSTISNIGLATDVYNNSTETFNPLVRLVASTRTITHIGLPYLIYNVELTARLVEALRHNPHILDLSYFVTTPTCFEPLLRRNIHNAGMKHPTLFDRMQARVARCDGGCADDEDAGEVDEAPPPSQRQRTQ